MNSTHPVVQMQVQTPLAPGESTTFRVASLGAAKQARAAVGAVSMPTIGQSEVEQRTVICGKQAG